MNDFVPSVSSESFLLMGNAIASRLGKSSSSTAIVRFRSYFGISPLVCSMLWDLLRSFRQTLPRTVSANHLLWALCFLKTYQSYYVLSSLVGGVDEKTYKEWVWKFVVAISKLKRYVIKWDKRLKGDVGYEFLVSVDGTDFMIPNKVHFLVLSFPISLKVLDYATKWAYQSLGGTLFGLTDLFCLESGQT